MAPHGEKHWHETAARVVHYPMQAIRGRGIDIVEPSHRLRQLVERRAFLPGGRYLYAAGNDYHQVQNCLLLDVEDTRESWADLSHKTFMALMTGAGIGVYYGKLREHGAPIRRTGGIATGPTPLAAAINEQARAAVQGGNRRSAIWGGLLWNHPDIFQWMSAKDWPEYIMEQKHKDPFNTPAPLDMTNISVCLDDDFFAAFGNPVDPQHDLAQSVYWEAIERMVTKGEPGFSIDLGDKTDEKLRNACTEITSADDSDICNLGGLNIAAFDTPQEFGQAVRDGVLFLLAGTEYSDVPYEKVREIREKNRRLGLDIMGPHEFLLKRGMKYGSDDGFNALEPYMREYDRALEYAADWADRMLMSRPVAATAGSPTGTRGIVAETTPSWQVVTYSAYKRGVLNSGGAGGNVNRSEIVVDATVARLAREGYIGPYDEVEDSTTVGYEEQMRMQQYAQSHTDHGISMTINLQHVMSNAQEQRSFGETLLKYLPDLRGITVYPDGAIPGQPIQRVSMAEALGSDATVEGDEGRCLSGICAV
jgi:ribonucleoside-diphosphate reductase alpha chain